MDKRQLLTELFNRVNKSALIPEDLNKHLHKIKPSVWESHLSKLKRTKVNLRDDKDKLLVQKYMLNKEKDSLEQWEKYLNSGEDQEQNKKIESYYNLQKKSYDFFIKMKPIPILFSGLIYKKNIDYHDIWFYSNMDKNIYLHTSVFSPRILIWLKSTSKEMFLPSFLIFSFKIINEHIPKGQGFKKADVKFNYKNWIASYKRK